MKLMTTPAPLRAVSLAVSFAALMAGPAAAACFDQTALTRGLTVRYDNGDFTTVRRTGDGYHQIDEFYEQGTSMMRFRAHRGIYFVEEYEPDPSGRPVPGSGLIVEFADDPATLPDPAVGVTWTGRTLNRFDDGSTRPEQATVIFAAAPPITLSGCDYEVIATTVAYDWGDEGGLRLTYAYLPAIGTTVLLSSQFEDDELYSYVPVGLEPATK